MFKHIESFSETLEPIARKQDNATRAANVESCLKFMNRMIRNHGFIWCASKLPKRMPQIFIYDKEKRLITLTEEASKGVWYIAKKGKVIKN